MDINVGQKILIFTKMYFLLKVLDAKLINVTDCFSRTFYFVLKVMYIKLIQFFSVSETVRIDMLTSRFVSCEMLW